MRSLAPFVVLCASAIAQGATWVVDVNNGPGTHFTSLVTAIAAVADGDTLVVLGGAYVGNLVTNKGLTLLGRGQVSIEATNPAQSTVLVQGLVAGRTLSLKNLRCVAAAGATALQLVANPGRIHLEGVEVVAPYSLLHGPRGLQVDDCAAVTLSRCLLSGAPALDASRSFLSISDSDLIGSSWCDPLTCRNGPGIRAFDSTVLLAQCRVSGGMGGGFISPTPSSPGIVGTNSQWSVTGQAGARVVAGNGPTAMPAIDLVGGTLRLDPAVSLVGNFSAPIGGSATVLRRRIPGLVGRGAPPGSALTATVLSASGGPFVLAASVITDPVSLPLGVLLLDPQLLIPVLYGVQSASEQSTVNVAIPPDRFLIGVTIGLQALAVDPATQIAELSNGLALVID